MLDIQTSEVDAKLHQSTWDNETLYADRPSKNEQCSIRPFCEKTKNMSIVFES
jgi:hypothetical protein